MTKYIDKEQQNKIIKHYIELLSRNNYTSYCIIKHSVPELLLCISKIPDKKYFVYEE
jgi:hypothetical protein